MTILSISRDWGTTPSIVRITDSANLSTITATGYVFEQSPVIEAIQKGEFEWAPTDEVLISYADGKGYFTYNPLTGTFIAQEDPFGTVTAEEVQRAAFNTSAATGANDAFVVTLSPAATALTDLTITMDSGAFQNLTASPTLKVNALPAKPIVTFAGSPAPGDIQQNNEYIFVYSLTNDHFQLINPSTSTADTFQVQSSGYSYALDTGVANAYIANILPAQLTTQSGLQVVMTAINANTGASTLTVNGATHPILLSNGSALTGGEILVNGIYQFFYSSALTAYVLMNSSASIAAAPPTLTIGGSRLGTAGYAMFPINYGAGDTPDGPIGPYFSVAVNLSVSTENITTMNLGTAQSMILGGAAWGNLTSFTANSVISSTGITSTMAALTTLSLPLLKYAIGSAITPVMAALTTCSLPSLKYITLGFGPTMALCTTLTLTNLSVIGTSFNPTMAAITTISLPAITVIGTTLNPTAANLVTFSLGSTLLSVGGNVTMTGMKLDEASVDGILVSLAALDGTGGTTAYSSKTVNLSGGTSSTPSAIGLAAKVTLVGRGCTVTNN